MTASEVWQFVLAPDERGMRSVDRLAEALGMVPDPFNPGVWLIDVDDPGYTSMRLAAETTVGRDGTTCTVEFRWREGEPAPSEWEWEHGMPGWLTVLSRPQRRRRAA